MNKSQNLLTTRRDFFRASATVGLLAGLDRLAPALQSNEHQMGHGNHSGANSIDLTVRKASITVGNRQSRAVTVNGTVPGPLVRLREGQDATFRVKNDMREDTSIHWHGLILPAGMDGVPGVSFAGIKPGETFIYQFPVKQHGTYWYHSHSGFQEQLGLFGPLIIDPTESDPVSFDREYVVMLSDWTFENPHRILARLKKQSNFYNFQQRTLPDLLRDTSKQGVRALWPTVCDGDECAWTHLTSRTSQVTLTRISSMVVRLTRIGRRFSNRASGCGCASSTRAQRPTSTCGYRDWK